MIRRIVKIAEEKCTGCGLCAEACHEGAIGMVNGKAKLLRDDYCDGLGDCLPACPAGAISFEEREALAYDENAVMAAKSAKTVSVRPSCHCPGSTEKNLKKPQGRPCADMSSKLTQWPVQIKLASAQARCFDGANLLVSADCAAYAYGNFHNDFIQGKVCIIGCPKLDSVDYSQKLTEIISGNDIRSITVARMQVPCCGGIEYAVKTALANSGKDIPCKVVTISANGMIL